MNMSVTITRNPNLTKARQQLHFNHELKKNYNDESWFTGLSPKECPGFDQERQCLVALPLLNLSVCTRQDILDYFNNSWTLTELLFSGLKVEEVYNRPPYHGLRHPLIFYYGHPAVLYLNKMRVAGFFSSPINQYLEKILEIGVDEMSWDDMSKNEMEWPEVATVHSYRKSLYTLISNLIKTHPDFDSEAFNNRKDGLYLESSPWWALWMGMEHEKIHFETSSVLIRELPIEYIEAPSYWPPIHPSYNDNEVIKNLWVTKKGSLVHLGKTKNIPTFGWDNEYGERTILIKDFQYSKFQVTNREYFEFVRSGSYIKNSYWSAEGIEWRKFRNTKCPTFWVSVGPEGAYEYELRTIFSIIPMPWSWPVEINFHEAEAYCHWLNDKDKTQLKYRLMTEAEFVSLRESDQDPVVQNLHYKDYKKFNNFKANFNLTWSTPGNVTEELYGNTWHWLIDQFNPLEQFKVHPYYDDFSTPCFDGKHQMIVGGSFISCGVEASIWARFHFRPHFHQHCGFRIAANLDGGSNNGGIKLVESDEYIHLRRKNVLDQMQEKSDWWKNVDQPLEMEEDELKEIFSQTQSEVLNFMKNFSNMSPMGMAHDPNTNKLKKDFILPYQLTKEFPTRPLNYHALIKMIFNEMAPLSQLPGHPGFAAYVAGGGNFISNTAQLISQTLNPFTGHFMMAPGLVLLEQEVIKWFIHLMGFDDKKALGYLTTGGSSATMNALMMARIKKLEGYDYSKVTAYMSAEAHHCVAKAWVMLGFKKENLRLIKTNKFKIDSDALQLAIHEDRNNGMKPFFLVATVGTTKTGSIDSLIPLTEIAAKENLWLHADGAYGALFMLTEKGKKMLLGIDRCDSIALDPHKALAIPYGTGCLLVKDANNLSFDYISDDSYMPPRPSMGEHDYADISPELSRDYRGLRVWLPIKTLGIGPFILNLEEKLNLCSWLFEELKKIDQIEVICSPELTILVFLHKKGDEATKELLRKINRKETLFLSDCILEGKLAIRICLLGFRMHYERLQKALAEIKQMANEC